MVFTRPHDLPPVMPRMRVTPPDRAVTSTVGPALLVPYRHESMENPNPPTCMCAPLLMVRDRARVWSIVSARVSCTCATWSTDRDRDPDSRPRCMSSVPSPSGNRTRGASRVLVPDHCRLTSGFT